MGILRIAAIGTKAFIVGGAVYYSHDYGIWGNMKETEEGYSRLKTDLQVSVRNMKILLRRGHLHFIIHYFILLRTIATAYRYYN